MCGFDGVRRGNYFRGELIRRMEVEVRVGKLKSGKDAGKEEVTGEIIKCAKNKWVDWIWRPRHVAFKSGVESED